MGFSVWAFPVSCYSSMDRHLQQVIKFINFSKIFEMMANNSKASFFYLRGRFSSFAPEMEVRPRRLSRQEQTPDLAALAYFSSTPFPEEVKTMEKLSIKAKEICLTCNPSNVATDLSFPSICTTDFHLFL